MSAYEVIGETTADDEFLEYISKIKNSDQNLINRLYAEALYGDHIVLPFKDVFQRAATAEIADTLSLETKHISVPDFSM